MFQRYTWETVIVDEGACPCRLACHRHGLSIAFHVRAKYRSQGGVRQTCNRLSPPWTCNHLLLPHSVCVTTYGQKLIASAAGHRLKSCKGHARRVIEALDIKWLLLLTGEGVIAPCTILSRLHKVRTPAAFSYLILLRHLR